MRSEITFFTSTGIYPKNIGGPAVFLHYLTQKLINFKVSSVIFDFSRIQKISKTAMDFLKAIRTLTKSQIVVFNSPPINLLFLIVLISKILRKKIVFICHGGIFYQFTGLLKKLELQLLILQLRSQIIEYTIVPSNWLFKFINRYKVKSKIMRIPNGIDIREINSYPAIELKTRNNIGFIGGLSKIKGISTLIAAFSRINENLAYNLYLIGPLGDISQNLLEKIKKTPNIFLLGRKSHKKTISLMKGFDLLVLPSLCENFPLVILEAMACGKPIIATNVGGIPEIINDNGVNGVLIPPNNPDILANSIVDLLNRPEKAAVLSKNAFATAKTRFDWDKISDEYFKFLKTL